MAFCARFNLLAFLFCTLIGSLIVAHGAELQSSAIATDVLTPESDSWNDAFVMNLGSEGLEGEALRPRKVDGDLFVRFRDSAEQGLLVIPLWMDVARNGGDKVICTEGVGEVARCLEGHPEGGHGLREFQGGNGLCKDIVYRVSEGSFHETTWKAGDVILLHPFTLHSASWNGLSAVRIIINPPVSLREPMRVDWEDGKYSVVERKTLMELGKERLDRWTIVGEGERLFTERVRAQEKMKEEERRRLDAIAEKIDDGHIQISQIPYEIRLGQ